MADDPIVVIQRFVAGEMTAQEFRDRLYADDAFEVRLTNDPQLSAANYVFASGGVYHFVISQDFDTPAGVLNAQGALCDFLDRNGIPYRRTDRHSDLYNLILDAQPEWLSVDENYLVKTLLPAAGERKDMELRDWLSKELRRRFRFLQEPPRWIQSPAWPMGADGPLVFLGQLDVANYFHDDAAAYVFHDPATGRCETIIQVA